jgi:hypothetical protein
MDVDAVKFVCPETVTYVSMLMHRMSACTSALRTVDVVLEYMAQTM